MKSLAMLHTTILSNLGEVCSTDVSRDIEYMSLRVEVEGDSFLTITLPKFAKALERGLENGLWPVAMASSFRHHGRLPAFLRGFVTGIFDRDGSLLADPDPLKIWAVRQFCYLTHKVERECLPDRVDAAFDSYVATDRELQFLPRRLENHRVAFFKENAKLIFGELFQRCDNLIANWELVPKHGPGAVAEGLTPLVKWDFDYWTERLERIFPFWRYTQNVPSDWSHGAPVSRESEIPVRVISVPKTQSTPRIIAIEPSTVQFAQQGLKEAIYEEVSNSFLSEIVGFDDQERNQVLAHKASLDRSLATLDLSEASDRLHWWLVHEMLQPFPHLREYVMAVRSERADVPGHGVIPLSKYASMGSALTFPLEAIVFTTLAYMGMRTADRDTPKPYRLAGLLSVYGDDIIVPTHTVGSVIETLEAFGFKVNQHKSFWNGEFRESCGKEYFRGHDVSVTRLRKEIPASRRDAAELASFVEFRNHLYEAGLWTSLRPIDALIESLIRFEPAMDTSTALTKKSYLPVAKFDRWNDDLHRYERKLPYLHEVSREWTLDDEVGLYKWFLEAQKSLRPKDRYASQERPTAFSIYSRWTASV